MTRKAKPQNDRIKNDMEQMLESDDELPSDYEEISDIPAYQNDNRFNAIEFSWINKGNYRNCDKSYASNNTLTHIENQKIDDEIVLSEDPFQTKIRNLIKGRKVLLKEGILSSYDLVCLKSMKGCKKICTLDSLATMYWLMEYLMHKDLQAGYKFLKSCLVTDITSGTPMLTTKASLTGRDDNNILFKFDLVLNSV